MELKPRTRLRRIRVRGEIMGLIIIRTGCDLPTFSYSPRSHDLPPHPQHAGPPQATATAGEWLTRIRPQAVA
eukprot:COSAG01_NODE_19304_length_1018_cov_1.671382_1_plen_71_part_01